MNQAPAGTGRGPNAPRFPGRTQHVESWFFRANHPTEPLAIWLKATALLAGEHAVAEAWCAVFDGRRHETHADKHTVPLRDACLDGAMLRVDDCHFDLAGGSLRGQVPRRGATPLAWDLTFEPGDDHAEPLCMFPHPGMVDGRFPRNKLLTPHPVLRFSGAVCANGNEYRVDNWIGMQGHNWGPAHAPEYAWGQCVFTGAEGEVVAMVEAAAGKVKVGPATTPTLGLMVIRRAGREYRFNRIFDLWNMRSVRDDLSWSARFRGRDGEALLTMRANAADMVCLGYQNPDGSLAYCLNTKLAQTQLQMNPVNEPSFTCLSPHGGALEFLQRTPDARIGPPI